jgi:DNA-binding SARP family transcriptional activator
VEFGILGPLEVRDEGRLIPLRGAKQRALLAVVVLHANEVVSTDRLLEGLWGDEQPGAGGTALRVRVSQLRKALGTGGGHVVTQPPGYSLRIERGQLDLYRFEDLVGGGQATALTRIAAAGNSAVTTRRSTRRGTRAAASP